MRFLQLRRTGLQIVLLGAGVVLVAANGLCADHRIHHIEIDNRYVNIHFDTLPNRTYVLQYRSSVSFTNAAGTPTTGWSNLFVVPSQPFQNHYVFSDIRTNRQQRYYRLRISP